MFDNAPFNDPFGGWVYWTRVPLMNATKMEVVDGTTSSLYGNYALGGVVSIDSRTPQKRTLIFQPQFGIFSSKVPGQYDHLYLSLIHISEPTRLLSNLVCRLL